MSTLDSRLDHAVDPHHQVRLNADHLALLFYVDSSTTSARTITVLLPFLSQRSVTNDLLELLNAVETLRVDQIYKVVVDAVKQEMFDVFDVMTESANLYHTKAAPYARTHSVSRRSYTRVQFYDNKPSTSTWQIYRIANSISS